MSQDPSNPFSPPQAPLTPEVMDDPGSQFAKCPSCGSACAKKVKWTLWGGALGPSMFCHVKCQSCGTTYNGKTGRSNAKAITIYLVVSAVICFFAGYFFVVAM